MEHLNDQLMSKLRSVSNRYQEREEEFDSKYKLLAHSFEEFKLEAKKNREQLMGEQEVLKTGLLQKQEEVKLLKT